MTGVSTAAREIQREYFEIIERYRRGRLGPVWERINVAINDDPEHWYTDKFLRELLVGRLFDPITLRPLPDYLLLRAIEALARDIFDLWTRTYPRLQQELRTPDCFYYFTSIAQDMSDITPALIYFDAICLRDPIVKLALRLCIEREHQKDLPESSAFTDDIVVLFAQVLWEVALLLRYKDKHFDASGNPAFIVVPANPSRALTLSVLSGGQLALSYLSEIAREEFKNVDELVESTNHKVIPWARLAAADPALASTFRLLAPQSALDGQVVRIALQSLLASSDNSEIQLIATRVGEGHNVAIAYGLWRFVSSHISFLIERLWDSSAVQADAGISSGDWPFHSRIVTLLGKGPKPPAFTDAEAATLALQSEDLVFLADLSDEEIAFIRDNQKLSEIRRLLAVEHGTTRSSLVSAPEVADRASERFLSALATYKEELYRVSSSLKDSQLARLVTTAKAQSPELALTVALGAFGLVAAPPWSYILAGLGAVVGGQSVRGIVKEVQDEQKDAQLKLTRMNESALSVCLSAQIRHGNRV